MRRCGRSCRRDTGETYEEFLRGLAKASGTETPTREDLARLDRKRKKRTSNKEWKSPADQDARIAKMKDGRTHLAHKAEHAVDLDSGAIVAVTLQAPDQRMKSYEVRTYIPEKKQKGRSDWQGRRAEQQAVYQSRRRVRGEYSKSLHRRRGELIERSFAHCYETGGMRRCHLRGRQNILKRQLIHVGGAFNLSLILRKLLGAGTPRELKNRAGQAVSRLLRLVLCLMTTLSPARRLTAAVGQHLGSSFHCRMLRHRSRNMSRSATGC